MDYAYNIRGWLKAINDVNNIGTQDLFAFKLGYNEGTTPLYNGNISLTQWKTRNTDSSLKTYNYTYDALNRILTATDNTTKFNLTGLSYDKNGNIMGLIRQGQVVETPSLAVGTGYGVMDNLVYAYDSGNKLLKVTDNANDTYGFKDGINTGDDFSYDTNGNMLTDANKGITNILYNHLNLPVTVTFSGTNKKIDYFYDAVGTKLKKVVTDASSLISTEYAGNYVYESGVLQFFNTAEGYVEPKGLGWEYVYQYKDHLGNIRLSYADSNGDGIIAQTEIREENNYYPFGLKHKGYNSTLTGKYHKYGFANKEEQDELGLGWIDITARNYDPALGRWMNLDPLVELMRRHSPYNYAFDNPVYFIDADGEMPIGNNCCGDKPSPTERIKEGFSTFFSGVKKAFTQFFSDNGFGISGTGLKPTENVSTEERVVNYSEAATKLKDGAENIAKGSIQGVADATKESAETVSEAATYTTILTGGASAPVTIPLQKTADGVAGGAGLVSASVDVSDGDFEAASEKVVEAGVNVIAGKAASRVSKEATKAVTDANQKEIQRNVIETVIDWFKKITFEF